MPDDKTRRDAPDTTELLGPGLIHEMRHPLMGIKAGLELIARRPGSPVTGYEEWEMLTGQVTRLEELFKTWQDLLSPGRGAALRFELVPVVQRAVDLLAFRLRKLGDRWTFREAGTRLVAHGTPNAVIHAVTNLVVNALDSLDERGGGRLELRVLRDGEHAQVRVSDEGVGIPPAVRDALFLGASSKPPEHANGSGSGLGLRLARSVMRHAGGDVRVASSPDPLRLPWAAAEFVVELPAVVAAPAEAP